MNGRQYKLFPFSVALLTFISEMAVFDTFNRDIDL